MDSNFDLRRNGEHYTDTTPYKAFGEIREGEIYTKGRGEGEILVLRNHGSFCNVITLLDTPHDNDCIEVNSRALKYTNPGMVSYLFNTSIVGAFVKRLPDDEFEEILQAVSNALDLPGNVEIKTEIREVPVAVLSEQVHEDSIYKKLYEELIEKIINKTLG